MHDSILFTDTPRSNPDRSTDDPGSSIPALQALAGSAAVICVVLMACDMIAADSFIPVQMRILLLGTALGTLVAYLTIWLDARNQRRHDELLREMKSRLREACCAEAYVAGLARGPFPGQSRN